MQLISEEKMKATAMYRRWAYMVVAIIASLLISVSPTYSFMPDQGTFSVRSFSMTKTKVIVTQTLKDTGIKRVLATRSVAGIYVCFWAMLLGSITCFLMFYSSRIRIYSCFFTIGAAGLYYVFLVYYALRISGEQYCTLAPTWTVILPAIVLEMMILVFRNVTRYGTYLEEVTDEETD